MDIFDKQYKLIGIGDFSHGIKDIWIYRIKILKYFLEKRKNIRIFMEDGHNGPANIMNDKKIINLSNEYNYRENFPLKRYTDFRIYSSPTYFKFINLINKNRNSITIHGIDTENKNREKKMADIIIKNLDNDCCVNLFFAHNFHVDDREIRFESMHKYTAGHYLKKKLGNAYCIILSFGLSGSMRYDGKNGKVSKKPIIMMYDSHLEKYYREIQWKKNMCTLDKNFRQICEIGWSYDNNWTKTNIIIPKKINYMILFKNVRALDLF